MLKQHHILFSPKFIKYHIWCDNCSVPSSLFMSNIICQLFHHQGYVHAVCNTLMICSWTPSSVWGPLKQPHIVSTILSISLFPGVVLSVRFPVKWPYAISFWNHYTEIPHQLHGENTPKFKISDKQHCKMKSRSLTWRQSRAVFTIRAHFDWHANSNGRKYLSASISPDSVFGNGKAEEAPSSTL